MNLRYKIESIVGGVSTLLSGFDHTDHPALLTDNKGLRTKRESHLSAPPYGATVRLLRRVDTGEFAATNYREMIAEIFALETSSSYAQGTLPEFLETMVDRMSKEN